MAKPIKIRLTNRLAVVTQCSDSQYAALQDFWSFSPKGMWFDPRYKPFKILNAQYRVNLKTLATLRREHPEKVSRIARWEQTIEAQEAKLATLWDGKIRLLKRQAMSSGLFRATRKEAEQKLGVTFEVEYARENIPARKGIAYSNDPDYRHQSECVEKMLAATSKGGGIILAATGAGKTAVAALYFSRINGKCLFVVDQTNLLYQQQEELAMWLKEPVGAVGDSGYDVQRITVATRQTLSIYIKEPKFRAWYDSISVMIVDELHEQMGKSNFAVLEAIEPLAVFGLTATLQLTQKEVRFKAHAFAGPVLYRFPLKQGIERGVLNPVKVLQLLFPCIGDPEYAANHLDDILLQVVENEEKHSACEAIVKLLHAYQRYVIILTNRVQQLHTIDALFQKRHGLAYGAVKSGMRQQAIKDFEAGKIRLLIANKVFKKGVNIKRVDSMIDMAEMRSKNDAAQKLGRVVRLHDDKGMALYIDFGTQHGRYGTAASSRRRALRALGIPVKVVKVGNAEAAAIAVKKFLKKEVLDGSDRSGNLFAGLDS